MADEPLMTVKQAAEYLRVSPDTLYDWCARGQIPHRRLRGGGKGPIRFSRAELDAHAARSPAAAALPPRPTRGRPRKLPKWHAEVLARSLRPQP
jgi:excisionase family DNA binding protein